MLDAFCCGTSSLITKECRRKALCRPDDIAKGCDKKDKLWGEELIVKYKKTAYNQDWGYNDNGQKFCQGTCQVLSKNVENKVCIKRTIVWLKLNVNK